MNITYNDVTGLKFIVMIIVMAFTRGLQIKENSKHYKILVWPAEFSHWMNLKVIANELTNRGHNLEVLRSSAYLDFMHDEENLKFIDFKVGLCDN